MGIAAFAFADVGPNTLDLVPLADDNARVVALRIDIVERGDRHIAAAEGSLADAEGSRQVEAV